MPTRSEIVGTSTRSSSAWSTPINPVIPWYVGAESPSVRARAGDAVLPTTSGMRVCGTGSAVAPSVTTAVAAEPVDDTQRAPGEGGPGEVGLDSAEHDQVMGTAGAHDAERVRRPRDRQHVPAVDLDRWAVPA